MDFTWEAMETADLRVKQLRRKMSEWSPAAEPLGDARATSTQVPEAIGDDLDMPAAVVVVNELFSDPEVPDGQKYALLATWDRVLGLDLEREARRLGSPAPKCCRSSPKGTRRAWPKTSLGATSSESRLHGMGVEVMDEADGTRVRPRGSSR